MFRLDNIRAFCGRLLLLIFACVYLQAHAQIIHTVAGGGVGDGGVATSAVLVAPYGVVVDAYGNLYIADTYNSRIRKVASNGIITTVAGTGTPGYSGDGGEAVSAEINVPNGIAVDASGNLYIADALNNRIRKVATNASSRP